MSWAVQLLRRGHRRVAAHKGEAAVVVTFMVLVVVASDLSGLAPRLGRWLGAAGVAGGLLAAFATVWLPIAVIDFRRCTRETALRCRVEADLAHHAAESHARDRHRSEVVKRCEAVLAEGDRASCTTRSWRSGAGTRWATRP